MGGVVDAIGDALGDVVDAVGDAVEWVGDTVSNVVQAAIDDPLKAVVQVAAVATGNAWALPIIEGVDVLEEGGSIEDALKGAAITFATQQAVSFAVDSFGTPGVGEVSGTTQFFDDGSSIQFFDDGSTLATDTAGAVSSSPATDIVSGFAESGAAGDVGVDATLPSPDVEIFPLGETGAPDITPIAGTEAITPELVSSAAATTTPQFDTMEELLQSIGELPPDQMVDLGPPTDFYQYDDGSTLQTFDDGSTLATDIDGNLSSSPATDMISASIDPNAVGAATSTTDGAAEIVDRSIQSSDLPVVTDRPITDTIIDIGKELGTTVTDFVTENPVTSTVVGAGILGLAGGDQPKPPTTPEEVKKTYQYQPAAQIGATRGLDELWSAAQSIYGDKLTSMLGITPQQMSPRSPTPSPLLGGQAPGGGLGSLRTSYATGTTGPTFDVNLLTPEQIIRLQSLMERKKVGEI